MQLAAAQQDKPRLEDGSGYSVAIGPVVVIAQDGEIPQAAGKRLQDLWQHLDALQVGSKIAGDEEQVRFPRVHLLNNVAKVIELAASIEVKIAQMSDSQPGTLPAGESNPVMDDL